MAIVHLSPEMPRRSVQGYRREPSVPADFLTASLGSEYRLQRNSSSEDVDTDFPPPSRQLSFRRSFSSGRPRSNSVSVLASATLSLGGGNGNHAYGKLRKSWRGLGRSRSSSKPNAASERKVSPSDEDASVNEVDVAFTRIKEQLAKFAEEDLLLKERLDRLNNEINQLNTHTRSVKRQTHNNQTRRMSFEQVHLDPSSWFSPHTFSPATTTSTTTAIKSKSKSPRPIPVLCVSDSVHTIPVPLEQLRETRTPYSERAMDDWRTTPAHRFEELDIEREELSQGV